MSLKVADNVLELIGSTPLIKLNRIRGGRGAHILAKLELANPGGSVKDRIGLSMVEAAERNSYLKRGATIVEPTSGNTGIGLALVSAVKGYKLVLVMPDSMSVERRKLFQAYGAKIVLTPGSQGMLGAVRKAEELVRGNRDYFMPQQFNNPANPHIHYKTTGEEIWKQTRGRIDAFVAGVGTGGTLTGVGRLLKRKKPGIKIVAVEPKGSAVLSGGKPGPHKIQGIGAGFIPEVLERDLLDGVIKVKEEDAKRIAKRLAREEGLLVGISSGANVWASLQVAKKLGKGKTVVTILADTGERYLSTDLFK
ncbi:MAG TPA: cysteine synthase A [bacterium]|nr:cysteine synthase A [bacterium]